MTIENLILDGQVHPLFSEKQNNVKTLLSEMKMLASQYIETVWRIFCMQAELFKTKFNLMSLSFYSNDQKNFLTPPTAFWKCVFEGMFIWDTVMAELGMEISNNDSWLIDIKKKSFGPSFTEFKCLS